MAVGAMFWGITCTVKGKRTRLWRSWTGKKPEGAKGASGIQAVFNLSLEPQTPQQTGTAALYCIPWEALTHLVTLYRYVKQTYKSKAPSDSRQFTGMGGWLTHEVLSHTDQILHIQSPLLIMKMYYFDLHKHKLSVTNFSIYCLMHVSLYFKTKTNLKQFCESNKIEFLTKQTL